jgi:hypothetical protein
MVRHVMLAAYRFKHVRFEVLILVLLNVQVFGDVMLCHWLSGSKYGVFIFRIMQSKKHYIAKDLKIQV